MIHLTQVTKSFEGVPALSDVSFSVERGEFVFLTGPSGAGKTTLLKLLFCAEQADEGNIVLNGTDSFRLKSSRIPHFRRSIGFVFQDYKLLPNKTVFDNIALALKVVGAPYGDIHRRVRNALKSVGMYEKRHLVPPKLSGGEQQKAAIARALVNEPELLLADEPTGNLDPHSAGEVFRLFKEVNGRGTTVLVATHDLELICRMRKRVITMEQGRITDDGTETAQSRAQLLLLDEDADHGEASGEAAP
jgi:cell division transport system ATP-binding protein